MKRIAVWNTAFLGDAVLTLPLIQSIHAAYPEASIDFYVRQGFSSLFIEHPAIAHVVEMSRKKRAFSNFFSLAKDLKSKQYDLWICAHTSLRSSLIARLSGAKERVGYTEAPLSGLLFSKTEPRAFDKKEEIERLLGLLAPLDIPVFSSHPNIFLPQQAKERAVHFFSAIQGATLGIHPGSVWATKRWPSQYFAEIGKLALKHGASVLLFAGSGEEKIAEETYSFLLDGLSQEEKARVYSLAGKLSLPELAAYIGKLSCYLTNDSGPMHLAWAQHVPVTAIFGPTVARLGFFPRGENSHVMEVDLACRPCGLHGHNICPKGHHNCVNFVTPNIVWSDVSQKLDKFSA